MVEGKGGVLYQADTGGVCVSEGRISKLVPVDVWSRGRVRTAGSEVMSPVRLDVCDVEQEVGFRGWLAKGKEQWRQGEEKKRMPSSLGWNNVSWRLAPS